MALTRSGRRTERRPIQKSEYIASEADSTAARWPSPSPVSKRKCISDPVVYVDGVQWQDGLPEGCLSRVFELLLADKDATEAMHNAAAACSAWRAAFYEVVLGDTAASKPERPPAAGDDTQEYQPHTAATTSAAVCPSKSDVHGCEASSGKRVGAAGGRVVSLRQRVRHPSTSIGNAAPDAATATAPEAARAAAVTGSAGAAQGVNETRAAAGSLLPQDNQHRGQQLWQNSRYARFGGLLTRPPLPDALLQRREYQAAEAGTSPAALTRTVLAPLAGAAAAAAAHAGHLAVAAAVGSGRGGSGHTAAGSWQQQQQQQQRLLPQTQSIEAAVQQPAGATDERRLAWHGQHSSEQQQRQLRHGAVPNRRQHTWQHDDEVLQQMDWRQRHRQRQRQRRRSGSDEQQQQHCVGGGELAAAAATVDDEDEDGYIDDSDHGMQLQELSDAADMALDEVMQPTVAEGGDQAAPPCGIKRRRRAAAAAAGQMHPPNSVETDTGKQLHEGAEQQLQAAAHGEGIAGGGGGGGSRPRRPRRPVRGRRSGDEHHLHLHQQQQQQQQPADSTEAMAQGVPVGIEGEEDSQHQHQHQHRHAARQHHRRTEQQQQQQQEGSTKTQHEGGWLTWLPHWFRGGPGASA